MSRNIASLLLFVASVMLAPLATLAAPITVPTGLNPGDQYRLAFVTSTTRNSTSANIADYNAFVTTAANSVPELAALGTTWNAIGSTSTIDARDNTGTNWVVDPVGVPIYELADGLIATSNADLWDGSIATPLWYTEQGGLDIVDDRVWTGTLPDGEKSTFVLGASVFVTFGRSADLSSSWIAAGDLKRGNPLHLYAMSDVLTVVPGPSAMVLTSLAAIGLVVLRLRRKR